MGSHLRSCLCKVLQTHKTLTHVTIKMYYVYELHNIIITQVMVRSVSYIQYAQLVCSMYVYGVYGIVSFGLAIYVILQ